MGEDILSKWVLVVGGTGGIGVAIVRSLAQAGRSVLVGYHSSEAKAQAIVDGLSAQGHRVKAAQIQLNGERSASDYFESIVAEHGAVGSVVSAAGAEIHQPYIIDAKLSALRNALDIELTGFLDLAQGAIGHFRSESGGNFVTVTSSGTYRYPPGDVLSVVPKAGLEALVRGIAREEGKFNIRANAVAVGVVEAGMFLKLKQSGQLDKAWIEAAQRNIALRRFGEANEVAKVVAFLTSEDASYVSGQTIRVDGGYSV
ncbi:MAG: SDR family oxidoreductase [Myxococcota bacterium]|nr:SDR family oxidoreductase [Myxococcota bacterium]